MDNIEPRERLALLVKLRSVIKRTQAAGYVSPDDAHTLNSIGFSVVTGVLNQYSATMDTQAAILYVRNGHVKYTELVHIIGDVTGGYSHAPWGGPLSYVEIFGRCTDRSGIPAEVLYTAIVISLLATGVWYICMGGL